MIPFDSVAHTQAGLPSLLSLLKTEYLEYMTRVNAQRQEKGKPALDAQATLAAAEPFLKFCEKYLKENRPIQVFPVDMNYGMLLTNSRRCVVSPGLENLPGTMQATQAISISDGGINL